MTKEISVNSVLSVAKNFEKEIMKTYFDCLPCFIRQALESMGMVSIDTNVQVEVMRRVFKMLSEIDLTAAPPIMGMWIQDVVHEVTGIDDFYVDVKRQCNELGKQFYPQIKEKVQRSSDPFETAVRFAIAGNIIDFGVNLNGAKRPNVEQAIEKALSFDTGSAVESLTLEVSKAKTILYISDNTGEQFFDKILLEEMPIEKIVYSVRGKPILNDCLMDDAVIAGIDKLVKVIDNGSGAPGVIIDDCNEEFRSEFDKADLIIAKGQGNFETLNESDKNIFFMLKAKCPVVADHIGCDTGTPLLLKSKYQKYGTPTNRDNCFIKDSL